MAAESDISIVCLAWPYSYIVVDHGMGANPGGQGDMSPPPPTILKMGDTISNAPPPPPPNEFCLTQGPTPSELISMISVIYMVNPTLYFKLLK